MTVGVVVGTFGDADVWTPLVDRAVASIDNQTVPVERLWIHATSLHEARNIGIRMLETDHIICLDADDELDAGYVEAMLEAEGDIRRPATLGVYPDGTEDEEAVLIPKRDLRVANYIVIGAMFRRELALEIGGFRDWPVLEDWCFWRRMTAAGATVVDVPKAIYRVHVTPKSRNTDRDLHREVYRKITAGQ